MHGQGGWAAYRGDVSHVRQVCDMILEGEGGKQWWGRGAARVDGVCMYVCVWLGVCVRGVDW